MSGCPNIRAPGNATLRRDGDNLAVKCNNSDQTWYLVCKGDQWLGEVGNCSGAVGMYQCQPLSVTPSMETPIKYSADLCLAIPPFYRHDIYYHVTQGYILMIIKQIESLFVVRSVLVSR